MQPIATAGGRGSSGSTRLESSRPARGRAGSPSHRQGRVISRNSPVSTATMAHAVCERLCGAPRGGLARAVLTLTLLGLCLPACTGKGEGFGSNGGSSPRQEGPTPTRKGTADDNGFGSHIDWWTLEAGLARAKETDTAVMLVVHADWCGRCKELKPAFRSEELTALSEKFVMINVDQEHEPAASKYGPDGDYIPRIIFLDPQTGEPDPSIKNERRSRNLYFYTPADDIVGGMKKALSRHGST